MDSPKVNLYIETTIQGPAKHGGRYMWLLETIKADGHPATRQDISCWQDIKEVDLVLQAMIAALARMRVESIIEVYTPCQYIWSAIENGWLEAWQKNDWNTAKGTPIRHKEAWQQVSEHMEKHLVLVNRENHSYRKWMQEQLRKEDIHGTHNC